MSWSWELLTTVSVIALSLSVILQRILLSKDKINPYTYAVIFQALVGVLLMICAFSHGFSLPNMQNLLLPATISIVAYGVGHIMYAKTLQVVEASAFSVLFATQAVWIMLFGIFFFQESLTVPQTIGTIIIFSAVGLLVKDIRAFKLDKGTLLGLLTGVLFGVAIACWSYVGRYTDSLSWAALSFIGTALVCYVIKPQSIQYVRTLLKPSVLRSLLLLAVLYGVGCVAMLFAYKTGEFSVVTPLRQTSIILTVLLALLFIASERTRIKRKVSAALICSVGVILIVIS